MSTDFLIFKLPFGIRTGHGDKIDPNTVLKIVSIQITDKSLSGNH